MGSQIEERSDAPVQVPARRPKDDSDKLAQKTHEPAVLGQVARPAETAPDVKPKSYYGRDPDKARAYHREYQRKRRAKLKTEKDSNDLIASHPNKM